MLKLLAILRIKLILRIDRLFLCWCIEPIQARLEYIKGRFIEKLLSGKFIVPKDWAREVTTWGEGERKGVHTERGREGRHQNVWMI